MKAALCKSLDGPSAISIENVPRPEPGPGEALIRVRAAALNFLDTLIIRGKYQYKPALPFSPAAEFAGVVEAVGSGTTAVAPGDRVCGYLGWGAAREYVIAKTAALVPIPDGVDYAAAAAINVTYGTAMHGLKDRGRLKAGETLAVLGATGGAGLAAVEVGKRLGATVIAAGSSDEKLAVCRTHGADHLLNYATSDLKQGLRDLTGGKGVDVIYDCVGGAYAEPALRSIAWMGRFLVVGFAAGEIPRFPLNLLLLKSCDVAGVFWGEMATRFPETQRGHMQQVLAWIATGSLTPHIQQVMALERVAEAITLLDERKVTGKLILEI